jgi:hypothetical protein
MGPFFFITTLAAKNLPASTGCHAKSENNPHACCATNSGGLVIYLSAICSMSYVSEALS